MESDSNESLDDRLSSTRPSGIFDFGRFFDSFPNAATPRRPCGRGRENFRFDVFDIPFDSMDIDDRVSRYVEVDRNGDGTGLFARMDQMETRSRTWGLEYCTHVHAAAAAAAATAVAAARLRCGRGRG